MKPQGEFRPDGLCFKSLAVWYTHWNKISNNNKKSMSAQKCSATHRQWIISSARTHAHTARSVESETCRHSFIHSLVPFLRWQMQMLLMWSIALINQCSPAKCMFVKEYWHFGNRLVLIISSPCHFKMCSHFTKELRSFLPPSNFETNKLFQLLAVSL